MPSVAAAEIGDSDEPPKMVRFPKDDAFFDLNIPMEGFGGGV